MFSEKTYTKRNFVKFMRTTAAIAVFTISANAIEPSTNNRPTHQLRRTAIPRIVINEDEMIDKIFKERDNSIKKAEAILEGKTKLDVNIISQLVGALAPYFSLIELYTKYFRKAPPLYKVMDLEQINSIEKENGIPLGLFAAIIEQESAAYPYAIGPRIRHNKGWQQHALGFGQINPGSHDVTKEGTRIFDPAVNTRRTAEIFSKNLAKTKGNIKKASWDYFGARSSKYSDGVARRWKAIQDYQNNIHAQYLGSR